MLDIGGCILDCLLSLSFYHRSSAVSRVPVKVVGTQGIMVRSTSVGTCRSVGESGAVPPIVNSCPRGLSRFVRRLVEVNNDVRT